MSKMLMEKWDKVLNKDGLAPIKESEKASLSQLLENEQNYITEENNSTTGDLAPFFKILVPIYRRTYPLINALDLVGIQPMSAPVGFAYALRFKYGGNEAAGLAANDIANRDNTGSDADFRSQILIINGTATQFGNIAVPTNVLVGATVVGSVIYKEIGGSVGQPGGQTIKLLINLTAGESLPDAGSNVKLASGITTDTPVIAKFNNEIGYNNVLKNYTGSHTTAQGEIMGTAGNEFNTLNLSVERTNVEAKTWKLKAAYTLELLQDLKSVHGLDAENELINMAQYEIAAEINMMLLGSIISTATWTAGWSYKTAATPTITADGRFESEKFKTLLTKIQNESNKIAISTRRGAGNFVVASANVVTALQTLPNFVYSGVVDGADAMTAGLYSIGTLDGRIKVYVDTFTKADYALVGYKGASSSDAGVIYCPYVPLQIVKVDDPQTFQRKIGFMTRAATIESLFGSSNYYRAFSVDLSESTIG